MHSRIVRPPPKRKVGGSNPPGNANLSGILLADSLWLLAKQPSAFVSRKPLSKGASFVFCSQLLAENRILLTFSAFLLTALKSTFSANNGGRPAHSRDAYVNTSVIPERGWKTSEVLPFRKKFIRSLLTAVSRNCSQKRRSCSQGTSDARCEQNLLGLLLTVIYS